MGRNRNPGSDEAGSLFGRDQAGSLFARLRGWSPFSRTKRDISAARQAELRGDLPKAAALFGRAGANDQVARIMILRAESEPDPKLRLQHYVQAASIAPTEDPVKKIAQIRRAQMMTLIVKGGALSAASRADLLAAARDLEELGEASEAAAAYQLAGDHESEARALAAAGNIEELETLLERDQAKTRQVRNQQTKLEEIDLASMTGRRREALALAEELAREYGGAAKLRADDLRSKRRLGPIVRVEIGGKTATLVLGSEIVIGRSDGEIQIPSHAVSRKHLRIARRGSEVVVSDLQSRNGTTLRGIPIGGELPIGSGIEVLLGNEVPVRIAPSLDIEGAVSLSAGGVSYVASLGGAHLGVGDWALTIGAENWVDLAFTSPTAFLGEVTLTSKLALLIGDEVAIERGGSCILKIL